MKAKHFIIALVLLTLAGASSASAETAPLFYRMQPYAIDTGSHSNRSETAERVDYTTIVKIPGATWLRLNFSEAALGKHSYLRITSFADGRQQRLDAETLAQWKNTSAYFNGEAVKVELHVAPADSKVFARMAEVMVGGTVGEPETQCGAVDDRVASNDPRSARLLTIGCTAWLIGDGRFVTAGHCVSSAGLANTVEFNVPQSLSNGALQHPGPEDQYVVDDSTIVFTEGGIGNDWGVFKTFPNSQTGMTALEAQGSSFHVVQDLNSAVYRITGYGVDNGTANQTEQTSMGPNAGSSGTTLRYKTDTEGGNSGSPVIDEATGDAVGIHTNGGCLTSGGGSNSGTSNFNANLWAQIGNANGSEIQLKARAGQRGQRNGVALRWKPADGGNVNILRDGTIIQVTADDGKFTENLGTSSGNFTYQVCEADSGDCSNEVSVTVP
jgi:trimeric autotransporter adhesin